VISLGLIAARPLCVTFGKRMILGFRAGDPSRIVVWLLNRLGCGRREHAEWLRRKTRVGIIYGIMFIVLSFLGYLASVRPIILHRTGDCLGLNSYCRYEIVNPLSIIFISDMSLDLGVSIG
jgi:hypothetical protein